MTQSSQRIRAAISLCALCTALVFFWLNHWSSDRAEFWMQDFVANVGRGGKADPRFVFIGIDQLSYSNRFSAEQIAATPLLAQLTKTFPWSSGVWAEAVDRIARGGAKAIVLDVIFASPIGADTALRDVVEKYRDRIVLGATIRVQPNSKGEITSTVIFPSDSVLNYSTPTKAWAEPRVGFVNLFPDGDGVVRRATFRLDATNGARLLPPGTVMYSLAARAVEKAGQAETLPRTGIPQRFLYTAKPGEGYWPHSLASLFVPERWRSEFGDGAFFKDKIVIIGPAAKIFGEEYTTPFPGHPRMLEPELQLNIMSATLNHDLLRELSSRTNLFTIALGGIVAFVLALALRRWAVRLVVVLLGVIVYWIACRLCLDHARVMVLPLLPAVAFALSGIAVCVRDFLAGRATANHAANKSE